MAKRYIKAALDALASYKLSCALFLLLMLLTYLGTITQVEKGLYQAQRQYFESFFLVHWLFGFFPLPLPGGYLLMMVLFVNMLLGGIVLARKGWSKLGSLITHAGILVLLAGAFVSYHYSVSGHLTLYENDRSNLFQSYREWEIGVAEASAGGPVQEYIIPETDFAKARPGHPSTFSFPGIPFTLAITEYLKNSVPKQEAGVPEGLNALPLDKEEERNVAGADIKLTETAGGAVHEGILWGQAGVPFTAVVGGKSYSIHLRRRQWELPFTVALNKFTRELHPGTSTPKVFSSDVTRIDSDVSQDYQITMNEPLRHRGYTLYQSSWGPPNAGPQDRLYSTLAVVKNPADQLPLYATLIISLGMTVHFGQRLLRYLQQEGAKKK